MRGHCAKVVNTAGRHVINHHHDIAVGEKTFDQMRSDEAGTAGNKNMFTAAVCAGGIQGSEVLFVSEAAGRVSDAGALVAFSFAGVSGAEFPRCRSNASATASASFWR